MYVCLCKGITDRDITGAVSSGAGSYADVRQQLGVGSQCGQCASYTKSLVRQTIKQSQMNATEALFYPA